MLNLVTVTVIQSVIHRPAALTTPGSLLEVQHLRLHPRPTKSESAFLQHSQEAHAYETLRHSEMICRIGSGHEELSK